MADQDMDNGEDFSQDVKTSEDDNMNGGDGGDKHTNGDHNHGSADAPGRDDDRYVLFIKLRPENFAKKKKRRAIKSLEKLLPISWFHILYRHNS